MEDKNVKCLFCDKTFKTENYMKKHLPFCKENPENIKEVEIIEESKYTTNELILINFYEGFNILNYQVTPDVVELLEPIYNTFGRQITGCRTCQSQLIEMVRFLYFKYKKLI